MKALALAALAALSLRAQDQALDRVIDAADRLRYVPENDAEAAKPLAARFERYLREWIESQLPKRPDAPALLAKLNAQLEQARLFPRKNARLEYGYVGTLDVTRPLASVDALLVIAGATSPCGAQDSVYLYEWTEGGPVRTLESHGKQIESVQFSPPDDRGDRLVLVTGRAPDCTAGRHLLSYSVLRLPPGAGAARFVYSGAHSAVTDNFHAEVHPHRVRIDLEDSTIDPTLIRTHVLDFLVEGEQVTRIDPVALNARDFVDEWLTQPWEEMEKRSAAAVESWHRSLHTDRLTGEYKFEQACPELPNQWEVAVEIQKPDAGEDEDPARTVYFLVREYGRSRFEMADVGETRHGCSK